MSSKIKYTDLSSFLLQVDFSIVIHACIRLLVFSLLCLYQIFCFGVIYALHISSSFLYNMRTPVFFMCCIYTSSNHALRLVFLFMYQLGFIQSYAVFCFLFYISTRLCLFICYILPFFLCISQALFIHALHSIFLHILATNLGASLTNLSSLYLSRQVHSIIFRRYKQIDINHLASPYSHFLV